MRERRLPALTRPPPRCASFSEEEAVRRYERAIRIHRAYTEAYQVQPLDKQVDGAYRVQGSGGVYLVDIVDGSTEVDTCTCIDFLTNDLGTCKHLEVVRRMIQASRTFRTAYKILEKRPQTPTITVQAGGGLRLVKRGAWSPTSLRRAGWRQEQDGSLTALVQAALTSPPPGVRVVHAASPAYERLSTKRQLQIRRERIKAAIAEGNLHLDRLTVPLLPFQKEGAAYLLAQGRAMLADDLGLGEMIQSIAACEALCAHGEADRILIIAPAATLPSWLRELERLVKTSPTLLTKDNTARSPTLDSGARYQLISYESLAKNTEVFSSLQPDVLLLHEAQHAKDFRARTAQALRNIQARFVYVLTSLPMDRHLDDLYALVQLVDDEIFAPLWRFNLTFHEQDAQGNITGYKNLSKLRSLLSPLLVRRRKEEVQAQLPPLTRQSRFLPLQPKQQERSQRALIELAALLNLENPPAQDLQQWFKEARWACAAPLLLSSAPETTLPSPKLDELEQLLEDLVRQGSHRILIFSEHAGWLQQTRKRLSHFGISSILIQHSKEKVRWRLLHQQFSTNEGISIGLIADAAIVHQRLPRVTYQIHLDIPITPAQLERRSAVGVIVGQTRGLTEILLCAETGMERALEESLLRKREELTLLEQALTSRSFNSTSLAVLRRLIHEVSPELVSDLSPATIQNDSNGFNQQNYLDPNIDVRSIPKREDLEDAAPITQRTLTYPLPDPPSMQRAQERMRLAAILLEANFPCDAARAAYQGLAHALTLWLRKEQGSLPNSLREHRALVAALFQVPPIREKLPPALHATLARLHDMASLEEQGILLDSSIAREAISEVGPWIARIEELVLAPKK